MERPAFRNDIPQRVFLRVVNVAEHILRHPALQIPGGMPAHFRLLPGQVVGLMRIVFDVEQLFRRRQMVAVVVGSDIQVILKTNAALAYMRALAQYQPVSAAVGAGADAIGITFPVVGDRVCVADHGVAGERRL